MPRKRFLLILALSLVMGLSFAGVTAAAPQPDAPYIGVIRNHTRHNVSIPSANSDGTLIVPPGGWIEYVVWAPQFQLIGYVAGQPYYSQKIAVDPQKYLFKYKSYDFLAEIRPAAPVRKKRPEKESWGEEVEGLV